MIEPQSFVGNWLSSHRTMESQEFYVGLRAKLTEIYVRGTQNENKNFQLYLAHKNKLKEVGIGFVFSQM